MEKQLFIRLIRWVLCFSFLLLLVGCASSKKILTYIQDAPADLPSVIPEHMYQSSDQPYAMHCDLKYQQPLLDTTEVFKKNFWCVPLLFVNLWEANYDINCGADLLVQNLEKYSNETLVSSLGSFSHYPYTRRADARFRLEVDINSISSYGFYHCDGNIIMALYAYSYSMAEYLGPVDTQVEASYRLYDDDQLVYSGNCSNSDFLPTYYSMLNMSRKEAAKNLVVSVAQSIDNCLYGLMIYMVNQSNMILDIHNDVKLRLATVSQLNTYAQ
ncbi:MAG: hypothetical protein PF444_02175 [Bacteroidales bacterium]|jgi:hypothetical protein|nr:hypothetical protein [Bacteroidales bacterium]